MKALIITPSYAPYTDPSSLDIVKKMELFKQVFSEIDLVTISQTKTDIYCEEDNLRIFRIGNKIKAYKESCDIQNNNSLTLTKIDKKTKIKNIFKNIIINNLTIPDIHLFWIPFAYKKALSLIESKNYDFIITMSQTNSAHLVGLLLKCKKRSIRWITYWNDPWFANLNSYNRVRDKIEIFLENKVLLNSDNFILFSDEVNEKLTRFYKIDKNKILNIDGFYDLFYRRTNIKTEKITFIHTGDLYNPVRDISPFVEALGKLFLNENKLFQKMEFKFLGNIREMKQRTKLLEFSNVKLFGSVLPEICHEEIIKSDVLILFGNKGVKRVPSKIFEYIKYSKPIITIKGEENEPLLRIFNRIKRGPIIKNDVEDIYNTLIEATKRLEAWNLDYTEEIQEYNRENLKGNVREWLKSLRK